VKNKSGYGESGPAYIQVVIMEKEIHFGLEVTTIENDWIQHSSIHSLNKPSTVLSGQVQRTV
jgi:hypothetical protein